ncbi:hypothetical protein C1752_01254 [Acaryochloris thomasi RCC1774]|uniref:Uncharacterized protein n=1 Tax=Acaryochloris thomasi RCC1774 TaxID=1764569 RepID=A0A2W1JWW4_9CYAN|nr:oligosaccharide flippase family protein [Acaryochloris thomasi]PZD74134.1 hypothetical protein C1752_01254 [Acaryochloris thomasi RCC1774]
MAEKTQLSSGHSILSGTIWNMLAVGIRLPVGFITVVVLTSVLGPEDFGRFTLTTTVVLWLKFSITLLFEQATVKLVSEADDWRPIGAKVSQITGLLSLGAVLLLWVLADAIATLLQDPALSGYLRLLSLDIPLFCLARIHNSLLIGTGQFRQRALSLGAYWLTRVLLIVGFVFLGWSVLGALLGCMAGSVASLLIGRYFIRPALFQRSEFSRDPLWVYAGPLFISSMGLQIYDKLDLLAYKALGGTVAQAGIYALALQLIIIARVFAAALNPLLLSTLSRLLKAKEQPQAKQIAQTALRILLLQLPLLAMLAASAPEWIVLGFGEQYRPAASFFAWLIFSAVGLDLLQITSAILTGLGRPRASIWLVAPLSPVALCGYFWLIPRSGALGAAQVTTVVALLGGFAGALVVQSTWTLQLPLGTFWRSVLLSGASAAVTKLWPVSAWGVFLKLAVVTVGILIGFLLLGEFRKQDLTIIKSLLPLGKSPRPQP